MWVKSFVHRNVQKRGFKIKHLWENIDKKRTKEKMKIRIQGVSSCFLEKESDATATV